MKTLLLLYLLFFLFLRFHENNLGITVLGRSRLEVPSVAAADLLLLLTKSNKNSHFRNNGGIEIFWELINYESNERFSF